MKAKIESVVIGAYEYDSVIASIDGQKTEIVFGKDAKVAQYEGKEVELAKEDGVYKIKPLASVKKND
jgi:hypothetical protein